MKSGRRNADRGSPAAEEPRRPPRRDSIGPREGVTRMGPKTLVAWAGLFAGAALSGCTGTGTPVGGRSAMTAAASKPAGSAVQQPQQVAVGPRDPSAWANQPSAFTGRQPNAPMQGVPTGNPPAFASSPANGIIPAGGAMPPSGMPQPAPLPPAVNMPPANGLAPAGGLMPSG